MTCLSLACDSLVTRRRESFSTSKHFAHLAFISHSLLCLSFTFDNHSVIGSSCILPHTLFSLFPPHLTAHRCSKLSRIGAQRGHRRESVRRYRDLSLLASIGGSSIWPFLPALSLSIARDSLPTASLFPLCSRTTKIAGIYPQHIRSMVLVLSPNCIVHAAARGRLHAEKVAYCIHNKINLKVFVWLRAQLMRRLLKGEREGGGGG